MKINNYITFQYVFRPNNLPCLGLEDPGVSLHFPSLPTVKHLATNSISHLRPGSRHNSPAREDPMPRPNANTRARIFSPDSCSLIEETHTHTVANDAAASLSGPRCGTEKSK